ncbi:MAG: thiamine phosphate synthase [Clostridia bacterium]|nr:thiamine phosphate synthase [Clostridia bacterium]
MSSFKLIAISNRTQCPDLAAQIRRIAALKRPDMLILREKDLTQAEYEALARRVIHLCEDEGIECVLHTFIGAARRLGHKKIHLPMPLLRENYDILKEFSILGASAHDIEEAREAEALGASYITASNVFETDCKPGMPKKGTKWLETICESVKIPVYALGGINEGNLELIKKTSAAGACMMSGYMKM